MIEWKNLRPHFVPQLNNVIYQVLYITLLASSTLRNIVSDKNKMLSLCEIIDNIKLTR